MVMTIVRGAVYSVQMSFKRFRIGATHLARILSQKALQVVAHLPQMSQTIPMLVSKNSTTFLVFLSTISLLCSNISDIQTATDLTVDSDGFGKQLKKDFSKELQYFF